MTRRFVSTLSFGLLISCGGPVGSEPVEDSSAEITKAGTANSLCRLYPSMCVPVSCGERTSLQCETDDKCLWTGYQGNGYSPCSECPPTGGYGMRVDNLQTVWTPRAHSDCSRRTTNSSGATVPWPGNSCSMPRSIFNKLAPSTDSTQVRFQRYVVYPDGKAGPSTSYETDSVLVFTPNPSAVGQSISQCGCQNGKEVQYCKPSNGTADFWTCRDPAGPDVTTEAAHFGGTLTCYRPNGYRSEPTGF